jgi:heme-degrading monooxygenase HmoA
MTADNSTIPYYAVIFTSTLTDTDMETYKAVGNRMDELARQHPGCLGVDSCRDANGVGITVSYWKTQDDIKGWKGQAEHLAAQEMGRQRWYQNYRIRVSKVERDYSFERSTVLPN